MDLNLRTFVYLSSILALASAFKWDCKCNNGIAKTGDTCDSGGDDYVYDCKSCDPGYKLMTSEYGFNYCTEMFSLDFLGASNQENPDYDEIFAKRSSEIEKKLKTLADVDNLTDDEFEIYLSTVNEDLTIEDEMSAFNTMVEDCEKQYGYISLESVYRGMVKQADLLNLSTCVIKACSTTKYVKQCEMMASLLNPNLTPGQKALRQLRVNYGVELGQEKFDYYVELGDFCLARKNSKQNNRWRRDNVSSEMLHHRNRRSLSKSPINLKDHCKAVKENVQEEQNINPCENSEKLTKYKMGVITQKVQSANHTLNKVYTWNNMTKWERLSKKATGLYDSTIGEIAKGNVFAGSMAIFEVGQVVVETVLTVRDDISVDIEDEEDTAGWDIHINVEDKDFDINIPTRKKRFVPDVVSAKGVYKTISSGIKLIQSLSAPKETDSLKKSLDLLKIQGQNEKLQREINDFKNCVEPSPIEMNCGIQNIYKLNQNMDQKLNILPGMDKKLDKLIKITQLISITVNNIDSKVDELGETTDLIKQTTSDMFKMFTSGTIVKVQKVQEAYMDIEEIQQEVMLSKIVPTSRESKCEKFDPDNLFNSLLNIYMDYVSDNKPDVLLSITKPMKLVNSFYNEMDIIQWEKNYVEISRSLKDKFMFGKRFLNLMYEDEDKDNHLTDYLLHSLDKFFFDTQRIKSLTHCKVMESGIQNKISLCTHCDDGYHLVEGGIGKFYCKKNECYCNNGNVEDFCYAHGSESCISNSCFSGYHNETDTSYELNNEVISVYKCPNNICSCFGGIPGSTYGSATSCKHHDMEYCVQCNSGYVLNYNNNLCDKCAENYLRKTNTKTCVKDNCQNFPDKCCTCANGVTDNVSTCWESDSMLMLLFGNQYCQSCYSGYEKIGSDRGNNCKPVDCTCKCGRAYSNKDGRYCTVESTENCQNTDSYKYGYGTLKKIGAHDHSGEYIYECESLNPNVMFEIGDYNDSWYKNMYVAARLSNGKRYDKKFKNMVGHRTYNLHIPTSAYDNGVYVKDVVVQLSKYQSIWDSYTYITVNSIYSFHGLPNGKHTKTYFGMENNKKFGLNNDASVPDSWKSVKTWNSWKQGVDQPWRQSGQSSSHHIPVLILKRIE